MKPDNTDNPIDGISLNAKTRRKGIGRGLSKAPRQTSPLLGDEAEPTRWRKSFGVFTLIELMVVVSVMAILTSMLLPAISKTRDAAKRIPCLNNLKQIGIAQTSYSADYENWIVPGSDSVSYWFTRLSGYQVTNQSYGLKYSGLTSFETLGTFRCPAEAIGPGSSSETPPKFACTHYTVNKKLCGYYISGSLTWTYPAQKATIVQSPSLAFFSTDTNSRASYTIGAYYHASFRHGSPDPRSVDTVANCLAWLPLTSFRGKTNMLYFDGHAEAKSCLELSLVETPNTTVTDYKFMYAGLGL